MNHFIRFSQQGGKLLGSFHYFDLTKTNVVDEDQCVDGHNSFAKDLLIFWVHPVGEILQFSADPCTHDACSEFLLHSLCLSHDPPAPSTFELSQYLIKTLFTPQPHVVCCCLLSQLSTLVCVCCILYSVCVCARLCRTRQINLAERRVISTLISRQALLSADKRLLTECEGGSRQMLMEVATSGAATEGFHQRKWLAAS